MSAPYADRTEGASYASSAGRRSSRRREPAPSQSVGIGYEEIASFLRFALVDQHVHASPFLDFELRREPLKAAQIWTTFALHQHAITVLDGLVH
jgi:hypothetical protein